MKKFNLLISFALLSLALLFSGAPAWAEYPDKPVQFIVPFGPGDAEDILTRFIAEDFQKEYGVAAAVVNKPSGGGPFPGADVVAQAKADGSVIGSFVVGIPLVGHFVMEHWDEDTFEPVGIFLTYPFIIAAGEDAPYSTMKELAAYAKKNKVSLGHFGPPLPPTQATFALAKVMGFSYGNDAAFDALDCNTLSSGDVDVANTTVPQILPCLDKIKVLASITDERISLLPNVPTIQELYPELNLSLWNGLFVKKGTPQIVKDKLAAVAKKTMASERVKKYAADTGTQVYWLDANQSVDKIKESKKSLAVIEALLQ